MFAAGVGNAAARGSWDSFAGGLTGAIAGDLASQGILKAYSQQFNNFRAHNGFISNAARDMRQAANALSVSPGGKTEQAALYKRPLAFDKLGVEHEHPLARLPGETYTEIEAVKLPDGSLIKEVFRGPLSAMSKATQEYMATNPVPAKIYSVDTTTFTNSMANYTEANYGKPYHVDKFGRLDPLGAGRYTDSRELIEVLDQSEVR